MQVLSKNKLINLELKYRRTLLLNPLAEQPEFNVSEDDDEDEDISSIDNISKDLSIKPDSN